MKKDPTAYIQEQEKNLCRFVQELVRVPTVNPPGENYAECVAIFEEKLKALGLKTRVVRVPKSIVREVAPEFVDYPRYNLIARWDVGAKETVHFNGHYDVVPASGKWKFGPFEPKISNGWLYGRGACDMKGANAALCFALEAIARGGVTPKFNIEVSFTCDEETGGELGAGYVVHRGLTKADHAVVLEGASGREIGVGHNGIVWLDVNVRGRAAHGAHPSRGVNAFEKMAALIIELQRLKEAFRKRAYRTPKGKKLYPTVNVGGVFESGPGAKINTVPAEASFTIDRRVVPSESVRDAERELRAAIRSAQRPVRGLRASVSRLLALEPCVVDHQDRLPQALARAVGRVRRGPRSFGVTQGFTDLHYFVTDGGMSGVGYGAGGKKGHGVDERVRVRDLVDTAKVYATLIADWG